MYSKLKRRWGLQSDWDVVAVLIIFSLAGSSSVLIRKPVFEWIDLHPDNTSALEYACLYVLFLTPLYQLLFLTWGLIWRQWTFVWGFEKKMFKRLLYVEAAGLLGLGLLKGLPLLG